MKKKLSTLFLAVATAFGATGLAACDEAKTGQLKYELSSNGAYYVVTGIAPPSKGRLDVVIPDTYEGKPVCEIKEAAFKDCDFNSR